MTLTIPTLETERLILRAFAEDDFEAIAASFADEEHSKGFGGPLNRSKAWRWFASVLGHWVLRGYGFWSVEEKATGCFLGNVGIWNPEGWPEPELGWMLNKTATGKGIAYEAAIAARQYAYGPLGMTTLISCIAPWNAPSIALAKRLGAEYESTYQNEMHGEMQIFRHPSSEALT